MVESGARKISFGPMGGGLGRHMAVGAPAVQGVVFPTLARTDENSILFLSVLAIFYAYVYLDRDRV